MVNYNGTFWEEQTKQNVKILLLYHFINYYINFYYRVEKDIEINGLDIAKHGEPAYPTASYGHGWGKLDNKGS